MNKLENNFINFESGGTLEVHRTYNLWESSSYYNTNDLSPKNITAKPSIEKPKILEEEVIRDDKNRRIITKESLYRNTELSEKILENKSTPSNDWTLEYQKKQGQNKMVWKQKQSKLNIIQKKIDLFASQPVKIDKAASMMAKMGWEGGALGKTGTGITEPIIPNAAYAMNTAGFGKEEQNTKTEKTSRSKTKVKKPQDPKLHLLKEERKKKNIIFITNVLSRVLEFLRNDFEIEVMFDKSLDNTERKSVHDIIYKLDSPKSTYNKDIQNSKDMVAMLNEIHKYSYVLLTESEGEGDDRTLRLHKAAPEYMYMVTHYDLRNARHNTKISNNIDKNISDVVMEEEPVKSIEPSTNVQETATVIIIDDDETTNMDDKIDISTNIDDEIAENDVEVISDDEKIGDEVVTKSMKNDLEVEGNNTETEKILENIMEINDNIKKITESVNSVANPVDNSELIENIQGEQNESTKNIFNPKDNAEVLEDVKEPVKTTATLGNVTEQVAGATDKMVKVKNTENKKTKEGRKKHFLENKLRKREAKYERRIARLELYRQRKPSTRKTGIEMDNDNNPFTKSIINVQKNSFEPLSKEVVNYLIMEHFKDFNRDKKYTEFKFLGSFEDVEMEVINDFINNVWNFVNDADYISDDVFTMMNQAEDVLGVKEDCNGGAVIYKAQMDGMGT